MDADALERELATARRRLYCLEPDAFTAARNDEAEAAGDPAMAAAIRSLRKPTLAAWVVNAHVRAHPDDVERLADLGDRLRQAHQRLDAAELRTLSLRRRSLVADVSATAVTGCGRASVSETVRAEVAGTFDAAVADPDIAGRLGLLQRAETWSGFGDPTSDAPALTLVPRPNDRLSPARGTPDQPAARGRPDTAGNTKLSKAKQEKLSSAQREFDAADAALTDAHAAEEEVTRRVRRITTRLATLQHDLEQSRRELSQLRAATSAARRVRRSARSALDRAEQDATR